MKRSLSVLLVCLSVVLVCRNPGCHVHCSEHGTLSPEPSAEYSNPQVVLDERPEDKVEGEQEESSRSPYGVAQQVEQAVPQQEITEEEELQSEQLPALGQAVNTEEPLVEVRLAPLTDYEEEEEDDQPDPKPFAPQDQASPSTAAFSPHAGTTETAGAPEDIYHTPTSQVPPTSAVEVPSADTPVASSIDAEQSAADCEAGDPSLFGSSLSSLSMEHVGNGSSVLVRREEKDAPGTRIALGSSLGRTEHDPSDLDHGGNTSHMLKEQGGEVDPSIPNKDPGDMSTFDEWKKKMLEMEKSQSTHTSSNRSPVTMKKNFKNYASVECGAKILAANTEATSTSAILMENMDLYMLNPCSNKIWFVIDLCEPIQVKQLDVGNFELFSSTPKDFLVSISDRYPTNKWIKLGTFHARDERTLQSFPLDEQLYAKYVKMFIKYMKVELVSFFGSEHFCPLSLVRVFGTSMVEEYDYASERLKYLDEDYDYPLGYVPPEDGSSKNLIGSATNAILNMVNNIAANVLGAKPGLAEVDNVLGAKPGLAEVDKREANISSEEISVTGSPTAPQLSPTPISPPALETEELELSLPPAPVLQETPVLGLPVESLIVTLMPEDEEDPSQLIVTLLEGLGEEGKVEAEESRWLAVWRQESLLYCRELSSHSCVSTFGEYLYRRCSVPLALRRQRLVRQRDQDSQTGADAPLQPPTRTQPSAHGEKDSLTETPSASTQQAAVGRPVDLIQLEPSRTPSMPLRSFADPTVATGPATGEVPELPTRGLLEQGQLCTESEGSLFASCSSSSSSSHLSGSLSSSSSSSSSSLTAGQSSLDIEPPREDVHNRTAEEQPVQALPTATKPAEIAPPTELLPPPVETDSSHAAPEEPQKSEPPEAPILHPGPKGEEAAEEDVLAAPSNSGQLRRTAHDFYAELQNSELAYGNGVQVHGTNQKESVFMRLSNRIKALEMNMSLSSRYLEELSQRYRRQMEEMQRAFNKTIIKLQNTSRIAEEQDLRQTESIQLLQGQLENVTQLVFALSASINQLQNEVSERQCLLVASLLLCLSLALLLCVQRSRSSAPSPPEPDTNAPKSGGYPSPKRCFSSYDDTSLIRKESYPLVRSKSFQLPATEVGPDELYIVEPLSFLPENKKKKRSKMKAGKAEPSKLSVTATANRVLNGVGPPCDIRRTGEAGTTSHKESQSEGSSESSSQSEESYFCGIPACSQLYGGQPPAKGRAEKRSFKRRRCKPVGELPQVLTLQNIMRGRNELSVGAFRVPAVSGPV